MIKISDERPEICELRHCRRALEIYGKGIFIFALWATIRNSMYMFLESGTMDVISGEIEKTGIAPLYYMLMFYFLVLVDLAIRFFTAKAAIRDARGKKKRSFRFYIIMCVYMILITIYGHFLSVTATSFHDGAFDKIVALLLDIADVYTVVCVMHYSNKLKRLRKTAGVEVN